MVILLYGGAVCSRDLAPGERTGGNIVALTPLKVERTAEQLKKKPIEYGVLSDLKMLANELGVRFEMPNYLSSFIKSLPRFSKLSRRVDLPPMRLEW